MLLADLGADVIKVERPKIGDPWRHGETQCSSSNPSFVSHNRNKRSVCLDISKEAGRRAFLKLASKSNAIVENLRPGTMESLGIGFEVVVRVNPKIVYCSANCFGAKSQKPGYDTVAQAVSGLMSLVTDLDNPELRGPHFADLLTGLFAAYGVLSGVFSAEKTGKPVRLDVSMIGACMSVESISILQYMLTGKIEGPFDRGHRSLAFPFLTADHPMIVHLSTMDKFWENLLTAIGKKELTRDEQFATYKTRYANHQQIKSILEPIFRTKTRSEWLRILLENDVPCAPINTMSDLIKDEDVTRLDLLKSVNGFPHVLNPVNVEGQDKLANAPPDLGQNTEEVLREFGFTTKEIESVN